MKIFKFIFYLNRERNSKKEKKKQDKKESKKEKKEMTKSEPKKADTTKVIRLQQEIEKLKNQQKLRDEKFELFDSLLSGLDSVTQIYQGLSEAQKQRLTSKGVDLESGQKNLKENLYKEAKAYVEQLKNKVREEFLASQRELEREKDLLNDSIERQRNTMKELGLLDEADIDKSLAPLHNKLKSKLEELEKNQATIQLLSGQSEEIMEG